ncbi:MAG: cytidyltransferase, partial [Chlamydiia bacterium]|nr:cytidyltransferase [Chlamydiia bacterium]
AAAAEADVVVVTITPDCFVNKGPGRPVFSELLRAEAVCALDCVTAVAINRWPDAVPTIELLRPNVYVKGPDYQHAADDTTGGIQREQEAIERCGGRLHITDDVTFSSSQLINRHLPTLAPAMREFLHTYSEKHSFREIRTLIESLADLKVLVVGESIIDDYHYCRTLGKSGKEPILAVRFERSETFAGGILAVANHVSALTNHVDVLSFLGPEDRYWSFVEGELSPSIGKHLLRQTAPTIVKRRFVESYPLQKLFEVYIMDGAEHCPRSSALLCERLQSIASNYDVVIVVDYGHGMLSAPARAMLQEESRFLAVNTQVNAGNQGFHTISKYGRVNFICLSEQEARMDVRHKQRPLQDIALEITQRHSSSCMMMTRGDKGVLTYARTSGFADVPAFTGSAIDRIGAGDRVLSLSALCAYRGASPETLGLLGNAAGYMAVQTVGHRQTLDRTALLKFLEHTLK